MPEHPNPGKPTVNYDVAFSALRIRKTRASTLGKDTVYIKISVSVDGKDMGTANWDGTSCREEKRGIQHGRDLTEGYYDTIRNAGNGLVGMQTGPITDDSKIKVTFLVLNSGHGPNDDAYGKALDALSDEAEKKKDGGIWKTIFITLANLAKLLVADCDGPVAADSFTYSAGDIRKNIGTNPYWNWVREYQGTDSPAGCGGNSNYDATVQFTKHI
jgi:hypothetical protein